MNAEFAAKWVADLRTPGLKQAENCLFDGEGHCCLGRAEVVAGNSFERIDIGGGDDDEEESQHEEELVWAVAGTPEHDDLSTGTRVKIGMHSSAGKRRDGKDVVIEGQNYLCLASANDKGVPFALIADYIEANHAFL